jgi:Dual specificity phosphatase, catalytic domain
LKWAFNSSFEKQMWTWSLNWGHITDHIVIGTCPITPGNLGRIHLEAGATGVLSLQHDDCLSYWGVDYAAMHQSGESLGLTMARCPIRDFDVGDMRKRLPVAVSMLADMLGHGHRVYVHCTAGMGRAPTAVLGYLSLVEGHSTDDSIRIILKGRPEAVPAWEAYYGCIEDLVDRCRQAIERRAYALYQRGVHNSPSADWYQAQAEILRSRLTHQTAEC